MLNRYGHASMNGWDGNSISINNDEGFILAPQIGAGRKNDDNSFTGMFMGEVKEAGKTETEVGLFGYANDIAVEERQTKYGPAYQLIEDAI